METAEPVIIDAMCAPVGRRERWLEKWHPVDLMGETLRRLMARSGIDANDLDDVIIDSVLQWGVQHGNVARNALLVAGLPESVPGVSVDRQCGSSGQQAVSFAVQGSPLEPTTW